VKDEINNNNNNNNDNSSSSSSSSSTPSHRVFKTHSTWPLFPVKMPLHPKAKVVVVVRNIKDVAVSLFKHSISIPAHEYKVCL
jgi:hypothetical protein